MDRKAIYRLMQVEPAGIFVADIQVDLAGKVTLDCLYHPEKLEPFQLIFEGCQDVQWHFHDEAMDSMADVISLFIGQGDYQAKAIVHTDSFEISLLYRHLLIQKPQVIWSDLTQADTAQPPA